MDVENELFHQVKYDINLLIVLERFTPSLLSIWHF